MSGTVKMSTIAGLCGYERNNILYFWQRQQDSKRHLFCQKKNKKL